MTECAWFGGPWDGRRTVVEEGASSVNVHELTHDDRDWTEGEPDPIAQVPVVRWQVPIRDGRIMWSERRKMLA